MLKLHCYGNCCCIKRKMTIEKHPIKHILWPTYQRAA